MANFVKILTETISYSDEALQVHQLQVDVLQDGGAASNDPIGLVGDIVDQMGVKTNAPDQLLNPMQIQLQVRDKSQLLQKMRGGGERDFIVRLAEDGQVIFEGYLVLKSKKRVFFQDIPAVQMRAFDGLNLLNSTPIENYPVDYETEAPITVKQFLTSAEQALGIELGWIVYTNYNDPATDRHFPLDYQFKLGHLMRSVDPGERTWGKALELFAKEHFGMQIFQWNGRWHMVGRTERIRTPGSIKRIDMTTEQVTTVDLTGPLLNKDNAIKHPDGEVISKVAGVNNSIQLGDGHILNSRFTFDGQEIPYWITQDVSEGKTKDLTEPAVLLDILGTSSLQQVSKTILESKSIYIGGGNPSGDFYFPQFDVSIELEVHTDNTEYSGTEAWSELDLFRIDFVDPEAEDPYASVPLDEQVDVVDIDERTNETTYGNTTGQSADDKWFDVRLEAGQENLAKEVYSVSKTFRITMPNLEEAPTEQNPEVLTRRYVRPLIQPRIKPDQHGGDGSKITDVRIKSFTISRAGDQFPTLPAPVYSAKNEAYSVTGSGDVISRSPSLSNSFGLNSIFVLRAPQSGTVKRVEALALAGTGFPTAAGKDRLAMQAVDLERVNLRCRHELGLTPLETLQFDTDEGDIINLIPVMWKRSITRGFVEISGIEARYDAAGITEETTYGELQAGGSESISSGGGDGSAGGPSGPGTGITDHGQLDGLGDDDHPQYAKRSDLFPDDDAQNLGKLDDVTFGSGVFGNTEKAGTETVRVTGKTRLDGPVNDGDILLDLRLSGGRAFYLEQVNSGAATALQFRTGDDFFFKSDQWRYYANSGSLKVLFTETFLRFYDYLTAAGGLEVLDDADIQGALSVSLDALFEDEVRIEKGILFDALAEYLQTETFIGDFGGSGMQLRKQNGKWRLTVDDLTVRNQFKVFEILVQQLQAGASFLLTEGHRVEEVEQLGTGGETWDTSTEVWDTTTQYWTPTWKCYIPEDMLLQLDIDDLVKRQQYSGREVGVTNATIVAKEDGSPTPTVNDPRRSFTIYIEDDGSQPPLEGFEFARIGNLTDPDRQGGIIMTSSDDGAPYKRTFYGVDSHAKFGQPETIMEQSGRLDNLVIPDFPDLDGTQQNLWGFMVQNGYFKGKAVFTGGSGISNLDDAGLLATLDDLDEIPNGAEFGKVKLSSLSAGGLVVLSETVGDADDIAESSARKWAGESGADITAGNPQGKAWLTDAATLVSENDSITRLTGRVLDNIADGATYARVRSTAVSAGNILLSEAIGNVGDIDDGGGFAKVASTSVSAGKILLAEATGDLSDIADGGGFAKVASLQLNASGFVQLSETVGDADDITESAARKWAGESGADITAGNPQGKAWLTDAATLVSENDSITRLTGRVLDNIADGATYARVRSSSLQDGSLILSEAIGVIGDIADGGGFAKVLSTAVSGGNILLSEASGTIDDVNEGGTEVWDTSTEVWNTSGQRWTGEFGRVLQTQLKAGYVVIKGPSGQTIIDQGVVDLETLYAIDATVTGTLSLGDTGKLVRQEVVTEGGSQVTYAARFGDSGIDFAGKSGGAINKLQWHNLANPTYGSLDDNGNITGEIYSYYDTTDGRNKLVIRGQSSPSNVAASVDLLLTATRIQAFGELELNHWLYYDESSDLISGTGEVEVSASRQRVYVDVSSGEPIVSKIGGLPANGSSMPVRLINRSAGGRDFLIRDKNNAGLPGANIRTQNQSDIRIYDGGCIDLEWDGMGTLYCHVDRGN